MSPEIKDVETTVTRVVHHLDLKRWDDLRTLYAREVQVDYTSLFGGEAQRVLADALIGGWRENLASITTQHLLGPIEVSLTQATPPRAVACCHVRALHHAAGAPGGSIWEVLGHYVFDLEKPGERWLISGMRLVTLHQSGNTNLLAESRRSPGNG